MKSHAKIVEIMLGRDANGNRILRIKTAHERGFSIQTHGNLPATHRDGITAGTVTEVAGYVAAHGTPTQRAALATNLTGL
jgi:hypothetical protein